ncbi:hypothetical protein PR048_033610 [Dryococelus australis]|uniref:Uncharacterized protein n=1 Tax=Dryococelus australis TaxID=614101 RepID=A0ABQ9G4Y6_9NEOP|nr:hypothetical protein PR048_033610 [Dryococelus australis]
MKRLLEWKQRMLQSPLTRKPSGSSTRGTAQNELSKFYKQQVLRELANQEARLRDEAGAPRNSRDEARGSRRRVQQDDGGGGVRMVAAAAGRSRSQDGRRSSTSVSRYNSYSSDDEGQCLSLSLSLRPDTLASDTHRGHQGHMVGGTQSPSSLQTSSQGCSNNGLGATHIARQTHQQRPGNSTDSFGNKLDSTILCILEHQSRVHWLLLQINSRTELGDVRKARKRIRRPSQAGRSRQGSVEGKPGRRHPSVPPHTASRSTPSYENVAAGKGHSRVETSEVRKLRTPAVALEEIPPDADYGDQKSPATGVHTKPKIKHSASNDRVHCEQATLQGSKSRKQMEVSSSKIDNASYVSPLRSNKYPDAYLRSGSSSRKSSGDVSYPGIQDDRCSNGKHSDSGYDTLQAGRILPSEKDQIDLLTHHWSQVSHRRNDQFVYPAHWNSHRKTDKWNSKLEEGQLVKEYTYEYISSGNEKQDDKKEVSQSQNATSPPQNIVQNRIKSLEEEKASESKPVPSKESLEFQEPLKMSPPMYQPNEAHVSSLKNADNLSDKLESVLESSHTSRSELHNFVFGPSSEPLKDAVTFNVENSPQSVINPSCKTIVSSKSVKDLLADFERKSQIIKETQDSECSGEKRYVFSDTETLLYDTSSDFEGGMTTKAGSDDDKDDEVAAALGGRKEKFQSACRDLGRGHSKRDSDDLEVIMTPGFLRLSMAESMVTHENSDSTCTTPTNKKENTAVLEEHYVPMTPSKKAVLAPPDVFGITKSPSASQTIIMENIFGFGAEYEESSYVEMTEDGIVKSLLAPDNDSSIISKLDLKRLNSVESSGPYSTPESPRYCEIESLDKEYSGASSHYELLYRSSSHYEPVYMEVSSVTDSLKVRDLGAKKISKNEGSKFSQTGNSLEKLKTNEGESTAKHSPPTPPKLSLPDILNSSNTLMQNKHTDEMDRDSSDADDEASKDLNSLDAPRHPRFSLSDTFRPASYYLGASRAMMVLGGISSIDHQDSSDSDLVSPPPIPTSPPPIYELDNSLELQDSSLDDKKQLSSSVASSGVLEKFPKDMKNSHNSSLNELHSSGSETMESRHLESGISPDYLLKRRPVSEDMIDSLEEFHNLSCSDQRSGSDLDSVGSRLGLAVDLEDQLSLDIDTYLEDLQTRDIYSVEPYPIDGNYYNRSYISELLNRRESPLNDSVKIDTKPRDLIYDTRHREIFSNAKTQCMMDTSFISGREPKISPSPCRQLVDIPIDDDVHYENLHIIPPPPEHSNKFGGEQQRPVTGDELYPRPLSQNVKLDQVNVTMHDDDNESSDQQQAGAPYYYSDLLRVDDEGFTSSTSERSLSSTRCMMGYPYSAAINQPPYSAAINQPPYSAAINQPPYSAAINQPPYSAANQPLNNQRGQTGEINKRNDIGRKVNPIQRSTDDENRRLAEELRTTSAHFLGAADKSGQVDQRNIYQADTLKRRKSRTLEQSAPSLHPLYATDKSGHVDQRNVYHSDTLQRRKAQTPDCLQGTTNPGNIYPGSPHDKSQSVTQRRSRSLEGLVDDYRHVSPVPEPPPPLIEDPNEGGELWEEDTLWRESLRRVSLRHTRSMENLHGGRERQKVTREVTYVNDRMAKYRDERRRECSDEGYLWDQEEKDGNSNGPFLGEGGPPPPECFEIDRETLRQWDLMSSAPMLGSGARGGALARVGGPGSLQHVQQGADLDDNRPPSSTDELLDFVFVVQKSEMPNTCSATSIITTKTTFARKLVSSLHLG